MSEHVCHWMVGYLLANPFRKFMQDPQEILSPYLKKGMGVLDIGPGMGYFSLPMAEMVGIKGKVVCVDVQKPMLNQLDRKAGKLGLSHIIETRLCPNNSLGIEDLKGKIDFVLLFAVVHEIPNYPEMLADVYEVLKPGGKVLMAEPQGHVKEKQFIEEVNCAESIGFKVIEKPKIKRSNSVVFVK